MYAKVIPIRVSCLLLGAFASSLFLPSGTPRLCAQSKGTPAGSQPAFHIDSSLVLIPFHIRKDTESLTKVGAEDLLLVEDGNPREFSILEDGTARQLPLLLTVLFDVGGNQAPSFSSTAFESNIFANFVERLPSAQVAVYASDNLLMPMCRPTRDPNELGKALQTVHKFLMENDPKPRHRISHSNPPKGSIVLKTLDGAGRDNSKRLGYAGPILNAVVAAAREQAAFPGEATRALVVVSPGNVGQGPPQMPAEMAALLPVDRDLHPEAALPILLELGTYLYPVRTYYWLYFDLVHQAVQPRFESAVGKFLSLGPATDGQSFEPEQITGAAMKEILSRVAENVESEQLAAFRPHPTPGGVVKHRLEIRPGPRLRGTVTGGIREVSY